MSEGVRAGVPVGDVERQKALAQRVETTDSSATSLIFSLCGAVGLPAALVLTFYYGAWWSLLVLVAVLIVAGALSDALKK